MRESSAKRPPLDLSLRVDGGLDEGRACAVWSVAQRGFGAAACLALCPVFAIIALLIKLTSPGPVLFVQERPGYRGRGFRMLKFRTMAVGSECATALGTAQGDPAITKIGALLRNLKLDELPQLWNVARGEMELVGPRPIPTALHDELAAHIPGFDRRYLVKPGLTNVSQVVVLDNKLGEMLVEDWAIRFEGELHYIANKSFYYDVIVIAMTLGFVAKKACGGHADAAENARR